MGNEQRFFTTSCVMDLEFTLETLSYSANSNGYGKVNQAARDSFKKGRGSVAQGRRSAVRTHPFELLTISHCKKKRGINVLTCRKALIQSIACTVL